MSKATDGIVFVDAKPSEQLNVTEGGRLCFASLTPSNLGGINGLKPFKKTKRAIKQDTAKKIVEHLTEEKVKVNSLVVSARMTGAYINWAVDSLNRAREVMGFEWRDVKNLPQPQLVWNGYQFNFPLATGLSAYANVVVLMGLRYGILANAGGQVKHIKFALHNLPNNSAEGMRFMEALSKSDPDLIEMWSSNSEDGITFEIGNLKSYFNKGKQKPANSNPHAILVDWVAASAMAKTSPDQLAKDGDYSDEEVSGFAAIMDTIESIGAGTLLDAEDPELNKKVKAHGENV